MTDLVGAAAELAPVLAERATEAERLRRIPDATIDDLESAGLLGLLTPAAWGGRQVPVRDFLNVTEELAVGCASTSFVANVYAGVGYMVCLLPDEAQKRVFTSENPKTVLALNMQGAATRVDDGYLLSGKWHFCSGQYHAGWVLLSALTTRDDDTVDVGFFLVPRSECTAGDDWDVTGLAATGSDSLAVDNVFVSRSSLILISDLNEGRSESTLVQEDPYYQIPPIALVGAGFAGIPLGAARRALELFGENIGRRGITYTPYLRQADATVTHLQMAEAHMKLDEARFHAGRLVRAVEGGDRDLDLLMRWRCRADTAWTVRLCKEVADIVESASGASALRRSDPLQRIIRDLRAVALHALLLPTTNAELYGRVLCGLDPGVPI